MNQDLGKQILQSISSTNKVYRAQKGLTFYGRATKKRHSQTERETEVVPLLKRECLKGIARFPKIFDERLRKGLDRLISNTDDAFIVDRSIAHLRSVLLSQFFLQNEIETILQDEGTKHLLLKLFRSSSKICVSLAFTSSYGFQLEQFMKVFQSLVPGIQQVPRSFYLWRHPVFPYLFCYLETKKIRGREHSVKELREMEGILREQLVAIPPLTPGLFWPYNKEDAYRQIQLLQREIRTNKERPHVSIHFREQSSHSLEFLFHLVRPKSNESLDQALLRLPESLHFHSRFLFENISEMGNGPPIPIEVGVFSIKIPSNAFEVRGTINLLYARRYLLKALEEVIGPLRDYNGGLFEKQQEHFEIIRTRLSDKIPHFDLFAERVFYALHPVETWLSLSLSEAGDLFNAFSELIEDKKNYAVRRLPGSFTIIKTANQDDLLEIRRKRTESMEGDSHALLTFGDFHYLCLLGPESNSALQPVKEGALRPVKKLLLKFQEGVPPSLNPHYSSGDMRCRILNKLLFEGLTRINATGEPELAAARKITLLKEGRLYLFKLRPFSWSNGEKVTAIDYAASIQTALNDHVSHPELLFNIKNGKLYKEKKCDVRHLGIQPLDAETLEIELEKPDPYFLHHLAQPYFFPLFGSLREPKWFNGPYLVREETAEGVLLERNPYYWNGKRPFFEQVDIRWVDSPDAIYAQFKKGKVDWIGDPLTVLSSEQIRELDQLGILKKQTVSRCFSLYFNTKHPLLRSVYIRRALSLSIDRKLICQSIFPYSIPLKTDLPAKEEAQYYFEKGLQELRLTQKNFPSLVFSYSRQTRRDELAAYLQSAWRDALGIEIVLEGTEWNTFRTQLEKRAFEICGTIHDTLRESSIEHLERYEGPISYNFSAWDHPPYRELIRLAKQANDPALLLRQAQEILEAEVPFAPLFNYIHLYAHSPLLKNYLFDEEGCVDFSWTLNKK